MTEREYINKYIDFYTDYKIKQRGKKLYKENAVSFKSYNEKEDKYYFQVQGTKKYDVVISKLEKQNLTTYCSCPYD